MGADRGINCEHMQTLLTNTFAETSGVAGRSTRFLGSEVLQVSSCVCGQLGRKDCVWRGQAFRGATDADTQYCVFLS